MVASDPIRYGDELDTVDDEGEAFKGPRHAVQHDVPTPEKEQALYTRTCHIHPNNSHSRKFDLVVTLALIFTTLVTPYEVALLQTRLNTRFFVNTVVDLIYFVDMCRNFFLAYETNTGVLVVTPNKIALRYLRSWFFIDFLSVVPVSRLRVQKLIQTYTLTECCLTLYALGS
jgi:hypothetical protein